MIDKESNILVYTLFSLTLELNADILYLLCQYLDIFRKRSKMNSEYRNSVSDTYREYLKPTQQPHPNENDDPCLPWSRVMNPIRICLSRGNAPTWGIIDQVFPAGGKYFILGIEGESRSENPVTNGCSPTVYFDLPRHEKIVEICKSFSIKIPDLAYEYDKLLHSHSDPLKVSLSSRIELIHSTRNKFINKLMHLEDSIFK